MTDNEVNGILLALSLPLWTFGICSYHLLMRWFQNKCVIYFCFPCAIARDGHLVILVVTKLNILNNVVRGSTWYYFQIKSGE